MAIVDEIHLRSDLGVSGPSARPKLLVFMITGNPGLIEYYRGFLTHLYSILQKENKMGCDVHVYGASLAGFEVSSHAPAQPLTLDGQIALVSRRLYGVADRINREDGAESLPVILIGHSVGAYILLDTVSRWQKTRNDGAKPIDIVGGICLFPTVFDIAKSPTGRKVTPLLNLPLFALLVHLLVRLAFFIVPLPIVTKMVQGVTRMPENSAGVTAAFLKSPLGVRQALYMAKYEMRQMADADRWSDDVWGAPTAVSPAIAVQSRRDTPKLFFYWGEDDHWVANTTRDALIGERAAARTLPDKTAVKHGGRQHDSRPVMEIDRRGIPHGFCVRDPHSKIVAEVAAAYISQAVDRH